MKIIIIFIVIILLCIIGLFYVIIGRYYTREQYILKILGEKKTYLIRGNYIDVILDKKSIRIEKGKGNKWIVERQDSNDDNEREVDCGEVFEMWDRRAKIIKQEKAGGIVALIPILIVAITFLFFYVGITNGSIDNTNEEMIYNIALEHAESGDYDEAIEMLMGIVEYKDSEEQLIRITYEAACKYFDDDELETARKYFWQIEDYKDSGEYIERINIKLAEFTARTAYNKALDYYDNSLYEDALRLFEDLGSYEDCEEYAQRIKLAHNIAGGVRYSLALTDDGHVKSAGNNDQGQCEVESWEDIISIDGYGECTIGLKKDGTVKVAGNFSEDEKENISKWNHIVDVAAGELYVVALQSDGKVVSEGHNGNEQRDLNEWQTEKVVDIDAGWSFTVGLTDNGELLFAGKADKLKTDYGKDKDVWKDVIKIAASGGESGGNDGIQRGSGHVVGLKLDGTIIGIGDNDWWQVEFEGEEWKDVRIKEIAAGDWYTVALREDGTILITGENNLKPHTYYIYQEKIDKWKDMSIKEIAAGYGQTIVMMEDGTVDSMGFDDDGKLMADEDE